MNQPAFLVGIIFAILYAVACWLIARRKGRNPAVWAILGFLFPLVALILVLLLPAVRSDHEKSPESS